MVATVPFNYMNTTNAAGTFVAQSTGYVQGMYIDDPATRFQLRGGVLATTETLPMWGGVGVAVTVGPNTGSLPPDVSQGGLITRATNVTVGAAGELVGFSVFNQAYGMVNTPSSPVPLAASGMQVMYFELGSNAHICVAAAPAMAAYLEGNSIYQQVSWDYVGQQLIPYIPAYAQATVSSVTYTSATGILAMTFSSAPFGATYTTLGAYVSVSGTIGTGSGVPSLNGNFPITSIGSSGTVISVQAPTGLTASGLSGSTIAAGGGALNVTVLEIVTNSMTVSYNATTNSATWNYSGTIAVLSI